MPSSNFAIDLSAYSFQNSTGAFFATNSNTTAGSLQIGVDGLGNFVAYVISGTGNNLTGTLIGAAADTLNTSHQLKLTNVSGVTSFYVDGSFAGSAITPFDGAFGLVHIGVAPGAVTNPTIYLSDVRVSTVDSVATVPEPASMGLLACASLVMLRRRR